MATTFKMAALNVIFRRRSFLTCSLIAGNFKIDCKSEIQLHYVTQTNKPDNLKEWVLLEYEQLEHKILIAKTNYKTRPSYISN